MYIFNLLSKLRSALGMMFATALIKNCNLIISSYPDDLQKEGASRIKKGNGVFVQLYPVWRNHNISKEVKIRIFNTNVKLVLLYVCETWKTTNQIARRLQILFSWVRGS